LLAGREHGRTIPLADIGLNVHDPASGAIAAITVRDRHIVTVCDRMLSYGRPVLRL